ncbi:hypothetical protein BDZ45DRAFT_750629 [Acephala macrosclerotiorum]|nr:hypothetical protein BDZ45DRAFT_750629 [Acephala macrosclerotiorum]
MSLRRKDNGKLFARNVKSAIVRPLKLPILKHPLLKLVTSLVTASLTLMTPVSLMLWSRPQPKRVQAFLNRQRNSEPKHLTIPSLPSIPYTTATSFSPILNLLRLVRYRDKARARRGLHFHSMTI